MRRGGKNPDHLPLVPIPVMPAEKEACLFPRDGSGGLLRIDEKKFLEASDLVLHADVPRRGHVFEHFIQLFRMENQALKPRRDFFDREVPA